MRQLIAACLSIAAVTSIAGCGKATVDARSELEQIIREQLPDEAERIVGSPVLVQRVTCTSAGGNRYECIATVQGTDGTGGLATENVGIDGTCDERNCIWQATG